MLVATDTLAVSVGDRHSCAISYIGNVQCWGDNSMGQLGVGFPGNNPPIYHPSLSATAINGATSISAGLFHTCALLMGLVYCWGDNT